MSATVLKRIIPCLDVKDGNVVKGVKFVGHEVLGNAVEMAKRYELEGADELVLYDIAASPRGKLVSAAFVLEISRVLSIPFCVAGGIKSLKDAEVILASGADKISINSPALNNPDLINQLATEFGSQCVVIGIDTKYDASKKSHFVHKNTGDPQKTTQEQISTVEWCKEVVNRGAGEIVLNCMSNDGMRQGYEIEHLAEISNILKIPVIASGGAGKVEDFTEVFKTTAVTGALAASIFHKKIIKISDLKKYLTQEGISVRTI